MRYSPLNRIIASKTARDARCKLQSQQPLQLTAAKQSKIEHQALP
jgi:hypothetical protein